MIKFPLSNVYNDFWLDKSIYRISRAQIVSQITGTDIVEMSFALVDRQARGVRKGSDFISWSLDLYFLNELPQFDNFTPLV